MSCQTLISTQPPPECKNVFAEAGLIISQDGSARQLPFCRSGSGPKTHNEDTAGAA